MITALATERTVAKRELRLAVVIYGGASLAIYMHGVTKELLKLVRASKVYHENGADAKPQRYEDGPDKRPHDTEAVYFDLLKTLNEEHETRVVVDVIAGASAGAINGIMLAKALVDDASLDAHTDLWLTSADADELRAETVSRWRKWYLYPLLRALAFWLPDSITEDDEVRGKLARVARSSWFEPPFSGRKLCHRLLEALDTMRRERREGSSLVPNSQRLDVYASITDLFGYPRLIRLHDRLVAREREHGAYCRLTHSNREAPDASDFSDANVPALIWAARASSSYTGAFPPFRHRELMSVLAERGQPWPSENRFLRDSLFDRGGQPVSALFDPRSRTYVDGGIVNNKPFAAALEALAHRPADRQVERVVLYVEPDPRVEEQLGDDAELGYLGTIRAAASSIPRNQPILEELQAIMAQDQRARNNRRVLDSNRAHIAALVQEQLLSAGDPRSPRVLSAVRRAMGTVVASELGLAYRAYAERRLWRLAESLADEWAVLAGPDWAGAGSSSHSDAEQERPGLPRDLMLDAIRSWWTPEGPATQPTARLDHRQEDRFLSGFDVSFRTRWVQHLIRRINQRQATAQNAPEAAEPLATLKAQCYELLQQLSNQRRGRSLEPEFAATLIEALRELPVERSQAAALLRKLAATLNLGRIDRRLDRALATFATAPVPDELRQALLVEYLAFPLEDAILQTPGMEDGGPDPLTELRVERVSPADSSLLEQAFSGLRCRQFMGFLGFFNRGHREHDYLWGRLQGAERIVNLLAGCDRGRWLANQPELPRATSLALFDRILRRERRRLHHCDSSIAAVEEALEALGK